MENLLKTNYAHDIDHMPRLLAKLLRDLLHVEQFDTYADAIDALKTRASRLHIRYTGDDITAAVRLVESNTPIVRDRSAETRKPTADTLVSEPPIVSREVAGAIVRELWKRRGTPNAGPPKGSRA